jgi:hypothetical protein
MPKGMREKYMPKSMRKKESNNPMLKKAWWKKRREKDSPYFPTQSSKESHVQRSTKICRFRKIIKFPHTCTSWSKCMICISVRSGFWLSNIMWCKCAFFYTYPKIHISHVVGRMKRKENIKSLWLGSYTSERPSESLGEPNFFIKLWKTSKKKVDQGTNDKHFYEPFYLSTT